MKDITDTVRILARPQPFGSELLEATAGVGMSLREILGNDSDSYIILLNGETIPSSEWPLTFVSSDDLVFIQRIPRGDDNGDNVFLRIVLTIIIIIVAWYVAPELAGALWGSTEFWASTVMFVGMVAVNLLLAPSLDNDGSGERKRLNSLTGTRNQFAPFSVIPTVYGRHRLYPPMATLPWTEVYGEEQYLNMIFCIGLGEYEIAAADIKIGDTPATAFNDMDINITDQPTQDDIFELQLGLVLHQDSELPGGTFTRTTAANTEKLSIDLVFPSGLMKIDSDDADEHRLQIHFSVEYRASGSSDPWVFVTATDAGNNTRGRRRVINTNTDDWPPPASVSQGSMTTSSENIDWMMIHARTRDPIRAGMRWDPPTAGTWDVRVTRQRTWSASGLFTTSSSPEWNTRAARMGWTSLRSFNSSPAVLLPAATATFLTLRVRASDQLNGVIDSLNLIAEKKLRSWNKVGQTFNAVAVTRDPAWAYLDILTGLGNARPIAPADELTKIDLDALADWATANATEGYFYDEVIDYNTSVFKAISKAASVGRAAVSNRDGKWTVILEDNSIGPVQYFTPRNSSGFSSNKRFINYPHALKIRFNSEDSNYQEDEQIVYDDGFNAGNATLFETVTLSGITDADQAWKTGRYTMAASRLRPEVYTFTADVEHIVCQRGDHILVAHDIPLWGTVYGRITNVSGNIITLDEAADLDGATSYVIRVRLNDGTDAIEDVTLQGGTNIFTHTFTPSIPAGINIGDLVMMGEIGSESQELVVIAIEPGQDLTAKIICLDHNPAILTSDTGVIPPWTPNITLPADPTQLTPLPPYNVELNSDPTTYTITGSGTLIPRITILWNLVAGASERWNALGADVRYRAYTVSEPDLGTWILISQLNAYKSSASVENVTVGSEYEFQVRVISPYGVPSKWTASVYHIVDGDNRLPKPPTALTATSVFGGALLSWVNPASTFFDHIEVHVSNDDVVSNATLIATVTGADIFYDTVSIVSRVRYYWIRSVDKYGTASLFEPITTTTTAIAYPLISQRPIIADPFIRQGSSYWVLGTGTVYDVGNGVDGTDRITMNIGSTATSFSTALRRGPDEWDTLAFDGMTVEVRLRVQMTFAGSGGSFSFNPFVRIKVTDEDGFTNGKTYNGVGGRAFIETDTINVWHDWTYIVNIDDEDGATPPRFMETSVTFGDHLTRNPDFAVDFIEATVMPAVFAPLNATQPKPMGLVPDATGNSAGKVLKADGSWGLNPGGQQDAHYTFDTATASADPGVGDVRFNNTTLASVTALYISSTDNDGLDSDTILGFLAAGNRIYVETDSDSTRAALFEVSSAPTDNTGWWTIPVTVIASATLPANGNQLSIVIDWNVDNAGGGGEVNTGSNQGIDGVGVYDIKSGVDLQFRHVAPASTKVTTTLNGKDIDIDIVEGNILHNNLSGYVGNEHIDWTTDQGATNIHTGNYVNTVYTHPNHTGDVTSTGDGATVLITTQPSIHVWSAQQTFSAGIVMGDTDLNRPVIEDYGVKHQTPTVSANAVTVDLELGNSVLIDMDPATAAVVLTFDKPPASGIYGEVQIQVLMGTPAWGITWPSGDGTTTPLVTWQGGAAPTLGSADNVIDLVHLFTTDAGLNWYGTFSLAAAAASGATVLSEGTVTATTYGITSDGSADDIVLPEATTSVAGLLGADKWDEIVANTAKATDTGEPATLRSGGVPTLNTGVTAGEMQTLLVVDPAGTINYVHPTTAGNKHVPTGGATNQFLKYSASGTAVWSAVATSDIANLSGTNTGDDAVNSLYSGLVTDSGEPATLASGGTPTLSVGITAGEMQTLLEVQPTASPTFTGTVTAGTGANIRVYDNVNTDYLDITTGTVNTVINQQGGSSIVFQTGAVNRFGVGPDYTWGTVSHLIQEKAAATADIATYGQLWVKTAVPNQLWFTGDTGVDIQITDATGLAGAGTFLPLAGGSMDAASHTIFPLHNDATTPTIAFGDGDTGFYESADDNLDVSVLGTSHWRWIGDTYQGTQGSGPALRNINASGTSPNILPDVNDPDTGIGTAAVDQLSLIAGGVEAMRLFEASSAVILSYQANVGLTADVGSAQGNGVITSTYNVYSVVGTTGDAATLPAAFTVGTQIYVKNDGANSMDVFPASGDDAGGGANIAVAVGSGESATFVATTANATWTPLIIGGGGSGTVTSSGSPLNNQVAVFTAGTDIDGDVDLTFDGTDLRVGIGTSSRISTGSSSFIIADSTGGNDPFIGMYTQSFTTRQGFIQFSDGVSGFTSRNEVVSTPVRLEGTDSASAVHRILDGDPDGITSIYYDGAIKLSTATGGVDITGLMAATTISGSGAGITALTAANISAGNLGSGVLPYCAVSGTASAFKIPFINHTSTFSGPYALLQDSTATFTYNPSTNNLAAGSFNGVALTTGGAATNYLDETGAYSVPAGTAPLDWLRADAADIKTTGDLTFNDNIAVRFGTSGNVDISWDVVDLEITGVTANQTINFRDGFHVRLWDSSDTDWLDLHNDGTNLVLSESGLKGIVFPAAGKLDIDMTDNELLQPIIKDYSIASSVQNVSGTTATLTYTAGPAFQCDMEAATGNVTITLSGGPPSGEYGEMIVEVIQDTTVRTLTWAGGTFLWPGGTEPAVSAVANAIDIFHFSTWDGGTTWYGSAIQGMA